MIVRSERSRLAVGAPRQIVLSVPGIAAIPVAAGCSGGTSAVPNSRGIVGMLPPRGCFPLCSEVQPAESFWPHELESGQSLSEWRKYQRTRKTMNPSSNSRLWNSAGCWR
jgi:hypothetical protein